MKKIFVLFILAICLVIPNVVLAEVGIPFGLKWGDSIDTVVEKCKYLSNKYEVKDFPTNPISTISIIINVEDTFYKTKEFKISFHIDKKHGLSSINAANVTTTEQYPFPVARDIALKYFIDAFNIDPNYKLVRKDKLGESVYLDDSDGVAYLETYITKNSKINIFYSGREGTARVTVGWSPKEANTFFTK